MTENNVITKRKALPQIHAGKTSVAQLLDIKERYEEKVNSLMLYLKQMGIAAIILSDEDSNKSVEAIPSGKDTRNSNKRYSIRSIVNRLRTSSVLAVFFCCQPRMNTYGTARAGFNRQRWGKYGIGHRAIVCFNCLALTSPSRRS